jgi:tRNA/tmRNA/rRNA uracil-C5-methylase (TrmA/RlmC/RlmD family)
VLALNSSQVAALLKRVLIRMLSRETRVRLKIWRANVGCVAWRAYRLKSLSPDRDDTHSPDAKAPVVEETNRRVLGASELQHAEMKAQVACLKEQVNRQHYSLLETVEQD